MNGVLALQALLFIVCVTLALIAGVRGDARCGWFALACMGGAHLAPVLDALL